MEKSKLSEKEKSFLKKALPFIVLIGSLCCFSSVILVLLGLSTVAYAASLSDLLYGTYKWVFRGFALFLLVLSLIWYFYKKENVCSFDAIKRKRKKIINFSLLVLISGVLLYIFWLYVVVHYIGVFLNLWN